MKILLLGYGFMGEMIYQSISSQYPDANIVVVSKGFEDEKPPVYPFYKSWQAFISAEKSSSFFCAFIATPSSTHFSALKDVLSFGIGNIFVEKPAVINFDQYQKIESMACSMRAKIMVGYILRFSQVIPDAKEIISRYVSEGFSYRLCKVRYAKNKKKDRRAYNDMGVFEELYHVFDLLMGGVFWQQQSLPDISLLSARMKECADIKNRYTEANISFYQDSSMNHARVEIYSSFESAIKERSFLFEYERNNQKKHIKISFDNLGKDSVEYIDDGGEIRIISFDSDLKIHREMQAAVDFFSGKEEISLLPKFYDSREISNLYDGLIHFSNMGIKVAS